MPPQTMSSSSARFSFDQISVWSLVAVLVIGTLFLIPSDSVPFLPTKIFILGVGAIITLALYIIARLTRGSIILPPLLLMGALWLPALAYTLSTLFSGVDAST